MSSSRDGQAFLPLAEGERSPSVGRVVRWADPIYLATAGPGRRGLVVHALGRLGATRRGESPRTTAEGANGVTQGGVSRVLFGLRALDRGPTEAHDLGLPGEDEAALTTGPARAAEFSSPIDAAPAEGASGQPDRILSHLCDGLTEDQIEAFESIALSRMMSRPAATP